MNEKRFLGAAYALKLSGRKVSLQQITDKLGCDHEETKEVALLLLKKGLLSQAKGDLQITEAGRERFTVVFIGGGFEVIHPGHLHTIEGAKRLGDVLVAVVARDSTIRRRKGRDPVSGERERMNLLASLRAVDAAILGVEGDIYETLDRVRPDIVALGYDQYHLESDIEREAERRGMHLKVVRLGSPIPSVKTSSILKDF